MSARLVQELAADGVPVALTCRVLGISRSGLYDALHRPPSARAVADQALTATITTIHHGSRATYGAPRVHAELRLGLGIACGRKRVARLMRAAGLVGVCHRRKRRGQRPLPVPHEDLVQSSMQRELLDRRAWSSRGEIASAISEWIEGFYNPVRRHSGLGYRSLNEFEDLHTAATAAA